MTRFSSFPSPTQPPPAPDAVAPLVERLRAEADATDNGDRKALLLLALGDVEAAYDETAAARDLLAAVNAAPELRAPLDRLLTVIERRRSHRNLSRLLDRLEAVASTDQERGDAFAVRALHGLLHEDDAPAALAQAEAAVEAAPEAPTAWLALELASRACADDDATVRALEARIELASDGPWRAQLQLDLGELRLGQGDTESALELAEKALTTRGPATYPALALLADAGRRLERQDLVVRAVEALATLVGRAVDDASAGDALGVPASAATPPHRAHLLTVLAEARLAQDDASGAAEALDLAASLRPNDELIDLARLAVADVVGDRRRSEQIARQLLASGIDGMPAAALWLRVAESAAALGRPDDAQAALRHALAAHPLSLPGRALQLDMLGAGADPVHLGAAFEALAEAVGDDAARGRCFLLAADAYGRLGGDSDSARVALSQASMFGASPSVVARVARLHADLRDDRDAFQDATRRLLKAGAAPEERGSLQFDLARRAILAQDASAASTALKGLAEAGLPWLGRTLATYGVGDDAGDAAYEGLLGDDPSPETMTAARAAQALRLVNKQGPLGAVAFFERAGLSAAKQEEGTDPLIGAFLAGLLRLLGQSSRAARTLESIALAVDDDAAASLLVEAALLQLEAGDVPAARKLAEQARERTPASGVPLVRRLQRWGGGESDDQRDVRLADTADDGPAREAASLERLGVALRQGDRRGVHAAADDLTSSSDESLAAMAHVLLLTSGGSPDAAHRNANADRLAARDGRVSGAIRGLQYIAARAAGDDANTVAAIADAWCAATEIPTSGARQRLAAAVASWGGASARDEHLAEVAARHRVAQRLPVAESSPITAGAALLERLTTGHAKLVDPATRAARLVNAELSPAGCDPRRRLAAVVGLAEATGDDVAARSLSGWNLLVVGDLDGATEAFRSIVDYAPSDLAAWEGLRAVAHRSGDRTLLAEATASLGDAVDDDALGAEFWEEAANLLLDELGDKQRGELALRRAVERDVRRFRPFDRLFRIVRARKDGEDLLGLIAARLDVAEEPDEIAKLFWERARVLRERNDRDGALEALENVTMLEPDHVGALALSGEIYLTAQRFGEAAASLGRLATLDEAPRKQRLMGGVAAVDIYEKRLQQPERALPILDALYDAGLSTGPVRERLARSAASLGEHARAVELLTVLMQERESSEGRAEAARLCLALQRDKLREVAEAGPAVAALLKELPGDPEGLDVALSGVLPDDLALPLLSGGRDEIIRTLQMDPLQPELVDRLARVANVQRDMPLRQATLGALVSLGEGSEAVDDELANLEQRVERVPRIAIDTTSLPALRDPGDRGPIAALMTALAPFVAKALGPSLVAFGVSRKQKIDPRAGLPVRNEIAAWAGALGVGDFDLYIGGQDPTGVFGVAGDRPSLVIGEGVRSPLSPYERQHVARELFALQRGTTILRHREPMDVAALVCAACDLGGHPLQAPPYALLAEFKRLLAAEFTRTFKRNLPELAEAVAATQSSPIEWVQAATSTLDRLAALAAGDVSHVLAPSLERRGQLGASVEAQQRAARILAFVLSPTYLEVRHQLGMGIR